jgi:hypothetical protein
MDPVRQAIAAKLLSDPAVTGKLAGTNAIYHRRAPEGAAYPLVIFHRQSGLDRDYTFDGRGLLEDLWVIKAVDRSFLAARAEDIAGAVHASLQYADLPVTGYGTVKPTRRLLVDYGEPDGAEQFTYSGGMYELELIPT